ncbi:MAG: hypothetical protein FH758_09895 [Firmicutes bacterium]|nr:hypothetical protein [Bacillota bacterium]
MNNKRTSYTKNIPPKLSHAIIVFSLSLPLIFGFLPGGQGNEVASANNEWIPSSDESYIYNDSVNSYTSAAFDENSPRITLNMQGVDMQDLLSALAIKMGVNIILLETEPLTVTFKADNVTPRQAMEIVIHTKGLTYIQNGDTIIVGQPNALHEEYFDEMFLTRFDTEHIEAEKLKNMIGELGIDSRIKSIISDDHQNIIWVQGTPQALNKVQELIANVDIEPQTNYYENRTFIFKLKNIVAKDAQERLQNFDFGAEVKIMSFNNNEFGQEIMVTCPGYLENAVRNALLKLDAQRDKIKAPVMTITGENAHNRLNRIRLLLKELTDVSLSDMHISNNLGTNDNRKYVLWVEESPDKIQLIKDLIGEIGE